MIDLSAVGVALSFLERPAVLETPGGEYVEGFWRDCPASLAITAVIQASTQKDLIQYAIGDQIDGHVTIWTRAPLHTSDEDLPAKAQTIITPEGETYRIIKAGRRNEAGFTRAIGRLIYDRGRVV